MVENRLLDRWRDWETRGGRSSFFQSANWADLLVRHFPRYSPAPVETESLFIPLIRHKRCGWLTDSLYGMPMMTTGGIFTREPLTEVLWNEVLSLLAGIKVGTVVVSLPVGVEPPAPSHGFQRKTATTHLLSLENGWEEIWRRFDRHCRTEVRKALKLGVTFRRDESPEAVEAHWNLVSAQFDKWKPDPKPTKEFVREAVELPEGRLYQAWTEDRLVVSLLAFVDAGEIFFWQGARTGTDFPKGANNLLFSEVIRLSCEENLRVVNFGASLGNRSIERFKEDFGALKTEYTILKRTHSLVKFLRRA